MPIDPDLEKLSTRLNRLLQREVITSKEYAWSFLMDLDLFYFRQGAQPEAWQLLELLARVPEVALGELRNIASLPDEEIFVRPMCEYIPLDHSKMEPEPPAEVWAFVDRSLSPPQVRILRDGAPSITLDENDPKPALIFMLRDILLAKNQS